MCLPLDLVLDFAVGSALLPSNFPPLFLVAAALGPALGPYGAGPGHAMTRPGHAITRPGHAMTRPGHAITRPGHADSILYSILDSLFYSRFSILFSIRFSILYSILDSRFPILYSILFFKTETFFSKQGAMGPGHGSRVRINIAAAQGGISGVNRE